MIKFLEKEIVLAFHQDQIKLYGGIQGVRDIELLKSALAQPKVSFEGEYIHKSLFHKAAAYGFHLCLNHLFYDGNKRIALIAMYIFLYMNGHQIIADKKSLFAIIVDLANGKVNKDELATYLIKHSKKRSPA